MIDGIIPPHWHLIVETTEAFGISLLSSLPLLVEDNCVDHPQKTGTEDFSIQFPKNIGFLKTSQHTYPTKSDSNSATMDYFGNVNVVLNHVPGLYHQNIKGFDI